MTLTKPTIYHLHQLMDWFTSISELTRWSGPNFRFPFNQQSFLEDLKLDDYYSYALVTPQGELVAFGQFYRRLGCCHLSRLVINPSFRGQGIIDTLINKLCVLGLTQLQVRQCSLFVFASNQTAINAYLKHGFKVCDYPDDNDLKDCLYMIK